MAPAAEQPNPAGVASAHFMFEGRFQGRPVSWHCELFSLASIAHFSRQTTQRQFIEIMPPADSGLTDKPALQIKVGLNVAKIDAAVIKKTIIMVRNYKRLQMGRHEFGQSLEFKLDNTP